MSNSTTIDYDHQLPADHPPGVYWYHRHGNAADQIYGAITDAPEHMCARRSHRPNVAQSSALRNGTT